MESIRLHLIDLIHSTHLLYDLSAQATRHHLTIWQGLVEWSPFDSIWSIWSIRLTCFMLSLGNKTPFDHLTRLSRMESIRLHLIDLIHSTHLLYDLSAQATRHHLTIWQGLVEWSPFDSIWSIWSIRLTCFMASQLRQQDTIWPFD